MSVLFRRCFKTAIFSRFLKVAIATSNFIDEFYNAGYVPEFNAQMLKKSSIQFETMYLKLANKKQI